MEWETTKRLVDEYFVVIGPSSDSAFGGLLPADDPLEECRWIVLDADKVIRSVRVPSTPPLAEVGRRVLAVIGCVAKSPSPPP
jgi:hypothetical protein